MLLALFRPPSGTLKKVENSHAVTLKSFVNKYAKAEGAQNTSGAQLGVIGAGFVFNIDLESCERNFFELHGPYELGMEMSSEPVYDDSKHHCGFLTANVVKSAIDLMDANQSPLDLIASSAEDFRIIKGEEF